MIAKVLFLQRHVWFSSRIWTPTDEDREATARRLADNLAFCQGPCCSNKRELYGAPHDEISDNQPEIWMEPCHECLAAWNESCESWCPYQRVVKL